MSGIAVFMWELLWTAVTFGCCMILDMLTLNRTGMAWVVPEGAPTLEPKFWIGWSIRHLILVPLSFCLQYVIRRHIVELWPMWLVIGCLVICYLLFFFRDLFRQVRFRKP